LPTFERAWDRIEILFSSGFFRELISEDEELSQGTEFEHKLSKLDLGIMGFLWC
jgi:hypothetical protein